MKTANGNSEATFGQARTKLSACIEFLVIPILSLLIFAVLVIAEVGNRRRMDVHLHCER